MRYVAAILLLLILGTAGIAIYSLLTYEPPRDLRPGKAFWGVRREHGDRAICGGNLVLEARKPGVLFGMKKDGSIWQFSYLVVFKHRYAGQFGWHRPTLNYYDESGGYDEHVYTIGGKRLKIRHTLDHNLDSDVPDVEQFILIGEAMDLDRGRLFLVDLTADSPVIRQIQASLPGDVRPPGSSGRPLMWDDDVAAFGQSTLAHLWRDHPQIESFFQPTD